MAISRAFPGIATLSPPCLLSSKKTVIVDLERGRRGGSVYVTRLAKWLTLRGVPVTLSRVSLSTISGLRSLFFLLILNWSGRVVLRGTLPAFSPVALFVREAYLYVGSPVDRWSNSSRLFLLLLSLHPGLKVVAASKYTKQLVESNSLFRGVEVSYAKICSPVGADFASKSAELDMGSVAFAVLGLGDLTKGARQRVEFFLQIKSQFEVLIDVYGGGSSLEELEVYAECSRLSIHGFIEDPFRHFHKKHLDKPSFYLGFSLYEGLHMAVVDAARYGIPSILSDISAHRELEDLAGSSLLICQSSQDAVAVLGSATVSRSSFVAAQSAALNMANHFAELANSSEVLSP